jgi:hypothetical protein
VTKESTIFWDVTPSGSRKNGRFGGIYGLYHQGEIIKDLRIALAVTNIYAVIVVPSSLILFTLMMEVMGSFEAPILTRATRHHVPEDVVFHSHCCENLRYYTY